MAQIKAIQLKNTFIKYFNTKILFLWDYYASIETRVPVTIESQILGFNSH